MGQARRSFLAPYEKRTMFALDHMWTSGHLQHDDPNVKTLKMLTAADGGMAYLDVKRLEFDP
jgi:hypothetical protein